MHDLKQEVEKSVTELEPSWACIGKTPEQLHTNPKKSAILPNQCGFYSIDASLNMAGMHPYVMHYTRHNQMFFSHRGLIKCENWQFQVTHFLCSRQPFKLNGERNNAEHSATFSDWTWSSFLKSRQTVVDYIIVVLHIYATVQQANSANCICNELLHVCLSNFWMRKDGNGWLVLLKIVFKTNQLALFITSFHC